VSIARVFVMTVAAAAAVLRRLWALSSDLVKSRQPMRDEAQRLLPIEGLWLSMNDRLLSDDT
jgi:hypothetical protein